MNSTEELKLTKSSYTNIFDRDILYLIFQILNELDKIHWYPFHNSGNLIVKSLYSSLKSTNQTVNGSILRSKSIVSADMKDIYTYFITIMVNKRSLEMWFDLLFSVFLNFSQMRVFLSISAFSHSVPLNTFFFLLFMPVTSCNRIH